jgi:hypothetical protein
MKKILIALCIAFSAGSVMAEDYLIEPYLGYHAGDRKSGSTSIGMNGVTYGARAGLDYYNLQFGLDYMSGKWTDDQSPAQKVTPNNFGIFVGFKFPAVLRAYGTYFFNEKYKNSKTYEGTEFRIGLGLTTLPLINLNFEYAFGKLATVNGGTLSPNNSVHYAGITVSLPLEF